MDFEAKAREIAHRYLTMPNENHHCDEPVTPDSHIFVCNALTAAITAALSQAAEEEREACADFLRREATEFAASDPESYDQMIAQELDKAGEVIRVKDNLCQASSSASGEALSSPQAAPLQTNAVDSAYEEGRQAFLRGKSRHSCPYHWKGVDVPKRRLWLNGWQTISQIEEARISADDATANKEKPA